MKQIITTIKRHWPAALGLIIILFYLTTALRLVDYPDQLFRILLLAISPVAIFGVLSIHSQLASSRNNLSLQLGKVFGISAFVVFEIVMCVQMGTRIFYQERLLTSAVDEPSKQLAHLVYQGVNSVQFTMDIAFDVFYCLLIMIFSYHMLHEHRFGKAVGGFGIFAGMGLLLLNMWSFPYPPAESGLIDFGPLTGIWWVWVIVLILRNNKIQRNEVWQSITNDRQTQT